MLTKMIGIKKFRENITSLWKESREKNIRYIVLHHSKPIFEVKPILEEDISLEQLAYDVNLARKQVKTGETYSQDEVMKELGL